MEIEQLSTLRDVDRVEWDALAGDDVFASYGWLRTIEETSLVPDRTRYVVLRGPSGLFGAAACNLETPSTIGTDVVLFGRFARLARALRLNVSPALICGTRTGLSRQLLVGQDSRSPPEQRERMAVLLDAVEDAAAQHGATLCVRNVVEDSGALPGLLRERGYLRASEMPQTYLDVAWPSFADYLRALHARHPATAKNIPRELNRARRSKLTFRQLDDVTELQQSLHDLLDSHHRRLNGSPFPFRPHFIATLKAQLGDRLVVYVALEEDRPISVVLGFRAAGAMFLPMLGVDGARQRDTFVYFNNSYNVPIADAIARRMSRIYCGKLVYDTKVRRGFTLLPLSLYFSVRGRLRRAALAVVAAGQRSRIASMTAAFSAPAARAAN